MKKLFLITLMALAVVVSGCDNNDIKDLRGDVDELTKRVTTLEGAVESLDGMLEDGMLVKSVNALPDGSGYRIEFLGGASRADSYIDILHGDDGNHGVTPKIEVRVNPDGTVSIWHNCVAGYPEAGWEDTGVDIAGGPQGVPGVTPMVDVIDNEDGTMTIRYNVTAGYPQGGWVSTDVTLPKGDGIFLSYIMTSYSMTFILDDGNETPVTFPLASSAVRFEIMTVGKIKFDPDATMTVKFRANPSDANIPQGIDVAIANWSLDLVDVLTRAPGYVNETTELELTQIRPTGAGNGEYFADIIANVSALDGDYAMALVLNTGTDADPKLVSSGPFVIGKPDAPSNYIPVMSVTIDGPAKLYLPAVPTQFNSKVMPENATTKGLAWSSLDTSVATVDPATGVVTAVAVGTTTIKAKATDSTGFEDTFDVAVVQAATGISIDDDIESLYLEEGATTTLAATVVPDEATDKGKVWTSDDPSVATVDNETGLVTAVGYGKTTIRVKASDGDWSDSCEVTVIDGNFVADWKSFDMNGVNKFEIKSANSILFTWGGASQTLDLGELIWEVMEEGNTGKDYFPQGYTVTGTIQSNTFATFIGEVDSVISIPVYLREDNASLLIGPVTEVHVNEPNFISGINNGVSGGGGPAFKRP